VQRWILRSDETVAAGFADRCSGAGIANRDGLTGPRFDHGIQGAEMVLDSDWFGRKSVAPPKRKAPLIEDLPPIDARRRVMDDPALRLYKVPCTRAEKAILVFAFDDCARSQ